MAYEGLMVSVSGVRGRVGEALSPEIVARFAQGFGAWAVAKKGGEGAVVLGRDSRVSGPMFHRVAMSALQAVGARVIDRSEEHTSELQSRQYLVCRLLLEKKHQSRSYP